MPANASTARARALGVLRQQLFIITFFFFLFSSRCVLSSLFFFAFSPRASPRACVLLRVLCAAARASLVRSLVLLHAVVRGRGKLLPCLGTRRSRQQQTVAACCQSRPVWCGVCARGWRLLCRGDDRVEPGGGVLYAAHVRRKVAFAYAGQRHYRRQITTPRNPSWHGRHRASFTSHISVVNHLCYG